MSVSVEARAQQEFSIRIPRNALVFLIGVVTGFIWIYPVFGPPGTNLSTQENGASALRFLRLIAPLFVLFLVRRQAYSEMLTNLFVHLPQGRIAYSTARLLAVFLVLGIVPLVSGLLTANSLFLISAVLPVTFSAVTLVGIILLDEETLKSWVLGVTAATTAFLILGMITTHFAFSTYWGRPRMVLGFIIPVYTASAILGAMIFLFLQIGPRVRQMRRYGRIAVIGVYLGVSLTLLQLAQDRNQLVMLCIALICTGFMRKVSGKTRFAVFATLLLVPVALYVFVIFGSDSDPLWAAIDVLSSKRLSFFQQILITSLDLSDPRILFEAGESRQAAFSALVGFAATDSVYLTFLINYGLFALLTLLGFLIFLGKRLASDPRDSAALGVLCGLVVLYCFDGIGVTTSNLVLFILLAYSVRTAVLLSPQSRTNLGGS